MFGELSILPHERWPNPPAAQQQLQPRVRIQQPRNSPAVAKLTRVDHEFIRIEFEFKLQRRRSATRRIQLDSEVDSQCSFEFMIQLGHLSCFG
jgi:hypothetical protein